MTRQVASEHRCAGCGSMFYEDDIFEFNKAWWHLECLENKISSIFLVYEDGGEFAIQHHKDRGYWNKIIKDYLSLGKYSSEDTHSEIVRLQEFAMRKA